MLPSRKALEAVFRGKGKTMRLLLESSSYVDAHPAVVRLVASCFNPPSLADKRMTALNSEAETYGVESVRCDNGQYIDYLNVGKMYSPTLVRFWDGRYRIACLGDIIERHCRKGA